MKAIAFGILLLVIVLMMIDSQYRELEEIDRKIQRGRENIARIRAQYPTSTRAERPVR